jgi:hypothetical protein
MPRRCVALGLRVGVTCVALLTFGTPPEAQTSARSTKPALSDAAEDQARAAQRMDQRLQQQERAAQRAMSGICDGCAGASSRRGRRAAPVVRLGEDGLPYEDP